MSELPNDLCPFGPQYQPFWNMRYELFAKFDEAEVDAGGLYTMVPEAYALEMAKRAGGQKTLDICSGIGSMSIAFARSGQQVIAIEIDEKRVAMARHNARLYGVADQIDTRIADVTSDVMLQSLPADIHTVWFDPPWGNGIGDYRKRPVIRLEDLQLAGMDLRDLVRKIHCQEVMFRLPPNFDTTVFRSVTGEKLKFATRNHLLWYFIRTTREQFINAAD